jgi:hypothetical protein
MELKKSGNNDDEIKKQLEINRKKLLKTREIEILKDKINKINEFLENVFKKNSSSVLTSFNPKLIKNKENYEQQLLDLGISKDEIDKINENFTYLKTYYLQQNKKSTIIDEEKQSNDVKKEEEFDSPDIFIKLNHLKKTSEIIDLYKKIDEINEKIDKH